MTKAKTAPKAAATKATPKATPPPKATADERMLITLSTLLLPAPSWEPWRAFLKAIRGLPLSTTEAALVAECTGRSAVPSQPAREIYAIVGRRGGKSQVGAVIAVYLATAKTYRRARGERLTGMLLAADRRQARILKSYISGLLHDVPELAALVESETSESITLTNGVTIEIHTASKATVRGYSLIFLFLRRAGVLANGGRCQR